MKQSFTVRQGALDGVEAFLCVARRRNFRKAAAELGVTPSAMSQAVRALEVRLGAALFVRTTRSVGLTEAGEQFLSRAKPAFEEIVAASQAARRLGQRPTGLLRLSVPRAVVPLILEPMKASPPSRRTGSCPQKALHDRPPRRRRGSGCALQRGFVRLFNRIKRRARMSACPTCGRARQDSDLWRLFSEGSGRGPTAACAISLTSCPDSEERTGIRFEKKRVY
jgi:regulatory helix-turn-helix LysR family protein